MARHDDQVDALGLIGQLLDKMIPAQRIVPLKLKNDPGYYVLNESEIDRYVRGDPWLLIGRRRRKEASITAAIGRRFERRSRSG